jgi:hypothetical protein
MQPAGLTTLVSFSALYFLQAVDFTLVVVVQAFQLARNSIAVWIGEILADYEVRLGESDLTRTFMAGRDRLALSEKTFCEHAQVLTVGVEFAGYEDRRVCNGVPFREQRLPCIRWVAVGRAFDWPEHLIR